MKVLTYLEDFVTRVLKEYLNHISFTGHVRDISLNPQKLQKRELINIVDKTVYCRKSPLD